MEHFSEMKDKKETMQILRDHGWESDVAKKVMRFDSRGNVMINGTKGVQFVDESIRFYFCLVLMI